MTTWDIIALITGVLGVILTIKQNIWCWPIATISVIISGITFFEARLYGDVTMQFVYLIAGIYGWYYWQEKSNETFKITNMPSKYWLYVCLSVLIQSILFYFILKHYKGDQIIIDAILTASSFTCTYMMTKKWLQNWLFWIIIDLAYVFLYVIKDLTTYAILNVFFAVMAIYGYFLWKKQLTSQS